MALRQYRTSSPESDGMIELEPSIHTLMTSFEGLAETSVLTDRDHSGESLKLGIAVSERTVSRYLQGRPITVTDLA
jgi:hypothetical protein